MLSKGVLMVACAVQDGGAHQAQGTSAELSTTAHGNVSASHVLRLAAAVPRLSLRVAVSPKKLQTRVVDHDGSGSGGGGAGAASAHQIMQPEVLVVSTDSDSSVYGVSDVGNTHAIMLESDDDVQVLLPPSSSKDLHADEGEARGAVRDVRRVPGVYVAAVPALADHASLPVNEAGYVKLAHLLVVDFCLTVLNCVTVLPAGVVFTSASLGLPPRWKGAVSVLQFCAGAGRAQHSRVSG